MEFFTYQVLSKLRNRSYFQEFLGDHPSGKKQMIRAEGAWKITIYNVGATGVVLKDSAGTEMILVPGPPGFGGVKPALVLGGHPAVTRDDIIEIDFTGAGSSQLYVIYDRMVPKREDSVYPVDLVMKDMLKRQ